MTEDTTWKVIKGRCMEDVKEEAGIRRRDCRESYEKLYLESDLGDWKMMKNGVYGSDKERKHHDKI